MTEAELVEATSYFDIALTSLTTWTRYHGVLAPARPAQTTAGADWSHQLNAAKV